MQFTKAASIAILVSLFFGTIASGQTQTYSTPGSYTFTVPSGVTSVTISAWGGGGAGGGVTNSSNRAGGGGAGGSFARGTLAVTPGTNYTIVVGNGGSGVSGANGGAGENSSFGTSIIAALGGPGGIVGNSTDPYGNSVSAPTSGNTNSGTTSPINFYGGNGGGDNANSNNNSGAGGGSAGATSAGGNASSNGAGVAGTAGTGGGVAGAASITGGASNGNNGGSPGAGGSGARNNSGGNTNRPGGDGGDGQVQITWTCSGGPNISNFSTSLSPTAVCSGNSTTVTLSSTSIATGSYAVYYYLTGANTSTNAILANVTFSGSPTRTGTFTIPASNIPNSGNTTVTIGSIGCAQLTTGNTAIVTVSVAPTISGTLNACIGATTQLTGSGTAAASNPWVSATPAVATVSSTGLVTGVTAGTSVITYTNNGGCSITATVTVNSLPSQPTISAGSATTFCAGGSVILTSSAGTSYLWSPGGATTQANTVTTGGSYTVRVTNANGCQSVASTATTVTVNAAPTISGTLSACIGATTQLTGSATAAAVNPWVSATPAVATVSSTGLVTGVSAGTSVITYTNSNGCSITATVTVSAIPTISGTLNACIGATTQLTGSGTAAASNPWVSATTAVATVSSTGLVTGITAGTSVITYTNNNGCSITATVTVNALPTITGTLTICSNGTTQLTGSGTAASSNPWVSATPAVATVNATGLVTAVSGGTSVITYTNSNGCSVAATVTVTVAGTWLGTTSTDWFDASNWCGGVPTSSTNVIIPSVTNQPTIGTTGAVCNNLTINSGATLTLGASGGISVAGAFTKTGTLTANASSTFNYAQASGTQTLVANNYGNLTLSGGGTKTFPSGSIGIAGAFTPNTFTTATAGTIDFNGSTSQTIPAFNYNNLTSSSTGPRTLASSGTIGIANTFTAGSNTYTSTGSTVNYNGTASVNIAVLTGGNYNNLTISGSGTYTFAANNTIGGNYLQSSGTVVFNASGTTRTITVMGNFTESGGSIDFSSVNFATTINLSGNLFVTGSATMNTSGSTTNGTFVYSSTGVQTLSFGTPGNIDYANHTVNSGATLQLLSGVQLSRDNTAAYRGTILVNNGGTIDCANQNVTSQGSGTNAVFTISSGAKMITANATGVQGSVTTTNITASYNSGATYEFQGAATGTFTTTTANTVTNLIINRSAGVTLSQNLTATNSLDFQSGILTTGGNTITVGSAGSILNADATKYINGKLARVITTTAATAFPIGKGGNYRPAVFTYAAAPGTKTVTLEQFETAFPVAVPASVRVATFGSRYWNIAQNATGVAFTIALNNGGISPTGTVRIVRSEGGGASTSNATAFNSPNYSNSSTFATSNVSSNVALGETAIPLTITGVTVAPTKVYDGTTTALLNTASAALSGVVSPDVVTLSSGSAVAVYADKNVASGTAITITGFTLGGANSSAYALPSPSQITGLTADITARPLSITDPTVTKVYDGTTAAGTATLGTVSNNVVGETPGVSVNSVSAYSANDVASNYNATVSYTLTDNGPFLASNYSLANSNISNAGITPAQLTITGISADNKTYDGDATAILSGTPAYNGLVNSESFNVTGTPSATFDDKNAGTGKPVTITGYTAPNANYTLSAQPAGLTANITPKALTITNPTIAERDYNGTAVAAAVTVGDLTGFVGTETVTATAIAANYISANAGTYLNVPVTYTLANGANGGLASNYTLAPGTAATAKVNPLGITGSFTAIPKLYDGNDFATVGIRSLTGVLAADDGNVILTGGSASFDDAAVGTGKIVRLTGASITGTAVGNYKLVSVANSTGDILPLSITIADFRSKQAGDFSNKTTWEFDQGGGSWAPATDTPTINNSVDILHNVVLDKNYAVGSILGISVGGSLTIAPNANLEMRDNASIIDFNNQPVTVQSTSAGTGSIGKMLGTLSGAINVTVERYIPNNGNRAYRLLTAPAGGQTIKASWQENKVANLTGLGTQITGSATNAVDLGFDAKTPGTSMFRFNPGTTTGSGSYVGVTNTDGTLINSQPGWLVYIRGDRNALATNSDVSATTLRTKGTITQGPVTTSVDAGKNALVGNPYASAIDLRKVTLNGSLVGSVLAAWDPRIGTQGGYVYLTPVGSNPVTSYTASPAVNGNVPAINGYSNYNSTIQSGQAFFVQGGASAGSITIDENSKVTGSTNAVFRPAAPTGVSQQFFTNLYAKSANSRNILDGIFISLDDANANEVDDFDGRKKNNFTENLGMRSQGVNLAVEKRKPFVATDTVFFNTTSLRKTTYQLEFKTENLDANLVAMLEDTYLNTKTLVNPNGISTYDFTVDANAASSAASRFRVVFKEIGSGTLPVTFVSIKAAQQNNNIAVEWKVGNQLNLAGYDVERSADGRNFTKMATIAASTTDTYNWVDVNALPGTSFYRIKATDLNGEFRYTNVVKVTIGKTGATITALPNPVKGSNFTLLFTNQPAGKYKVNLVSADGKLVYSNSFQHAGGSLSQTIKLNSFVVSGVYQLQVVQPGKTVHSQKLIVDNQ